MGFESLFKTNDTIKLTKAPITAKITVFIISCDKMLGMILNIVPVAVFMPTDRDGLMLIIKVRIAP